MMGPILILCFYPLTPTTLSAPGAYILVFLGTILTGFIAGLGIILCFIGVVITISYANSVMGNLMGQAYNVATAEQQLEPVEAI